MNHAKRIRELRTELRERKLAVLIVVIHEGANRNLEYLSGFSGTTGVLAVSTRGAALAVDGRYHVRAKEEAVGVRVAPIPSGRREPRLAAYVRTALGTLNISPRSKVGFEGDRVSVLMAEAWRKKLRHTFIPTEHIVERMRGVKSVEEIRIIADACRRTARAFGDIAPRIRSGMREREVADMLEAALKSRGASAPSFETIVASGPNSATPHHKTGERKLRAGEPVVIDFGGKFRHGYVSDMTRTVFVPGKRPDRTLLEIYTIVREANERALRALRPGMLWREYDAVARSYIKERGYGDYFTHGLGHSLGLDVHDPYDYQEAPIMPGTIMTDEPGIYLPGVGGVRIEDDLLVTAKGARRLTPAAPNPF